jgi:hypothetical protein
MTNLEVKFLCTGLDDTKNSFHVVFDTLYILDMVRTHTKIIDARNECQSAFCVTLPLCALQLAFKLTYGQAIERDAFKAIIGSAVDACGNDVKCQCLANPDACIDRANTLQRTFLEAIGLDRVSVLSDMPTPLRRRLKYADPLTGPQLYRIICDSMADVMGRSGEEIHSSALQATIAFHQETLQPTKASWLYVCADFK